MGSIRLGGSVCPVELVFMDCDGVIFDANALKVQAFAAALEPYPPEARQRMIEHHRAHGGVSRYEKLRWFFREVHPVDDPEAAIEEALERFGEVSRAGYRDLHPRPEALAFAERLGGKDSVYVLSGSDQRELSAIFADKGLHGRFSEVLGSPTSKSAHMRSVLYERGVPPSRAVFVGDGSGDFRAAQARGVPFVFLREMSEWEDAPRILDGAEQVFVAETWDELLGWIE